MSGVGQDQTGGPLFGYTKELGYHPLLAFRADTGEVVGARLRAGASQRGVVHFAKETVGRIRRAGARGPLSVRADSGFWSYPMLAALDHLGAG
ncbi:MAG: transposase [bacterium]|nr:transposase [bacterium]